MNPPEEATPRTSALMRKWSKAEGAKNATCSPEAHEIYTLAETLERELAQLRHDIDRHVTICSELATDNEQLRRQVVEGQVREVRLKDTITEAMENSEEVLFGDSLSVCFPLSFGAALNDVADAEIDTDALISALAAERGKAFMEHGAAIAEWLNELYAVMVDPCAEGTMRVVDTKAAIMKSALATREELNRRANTQSALGNSDGGTPG